MLRKLESGAYFGQTRPLVELNGLSIVETFFAADLVIPAHEHSNPFFCFVLAGQGTRSWHGREGAERPMALTLFPAGVAHANCWRGPGGRVLHVEFEPRWLQRLGARANVVEQPADFAAGPPIWFIQRLLAECEHPDEVTPLAVEGLTLELLAACARTSSRSTARSAPRWMEDAVDLLHEHFREKLSLGAIAAAVHVSADHLARQFRKTHGCTVGQFLRRLRMEYACARLTAGRESLAEIAHAGGFTDQSHFTRIFQRHNGITPAVFRARAQGSRLRTKE